MTIYLQPIGQIDQDVLDFLNRRISALCGVEQNEPIGVPASACDPARKQYSGSALLSAIPDMDQPVLGITGVDIYADGLNYIFGIASGNKALISLKRLNPEYYGQESDEDLLKVRALKEAMHELGHVFGLAHCPDKGCVMHFSNSIIDTDIKDWRYCGWCDGMAKVSA
ncbi:MAG TPA: archaemetzincin family Zn-dependent metalloprotease [Methanotrichaceae archaeon]|nr:archaemetzincin family Zn-dependent metalloprotease [Methanotrichaceae archaeon]